LPPPRARARPAGRSARGAGVAAAPASFCAAAGRRDCRARVASRSEPFLLGSSREPAVVRARSHPTPLPPTPRPAPRAPQRRLKRAFDLSQKHVDLPASMQQSAFLEFAKVQQVFTETQKEHDERATLNNEWWMPYHIGPSVRTAATRAQCSRRRPAALRSYERRLRPSVTKSSKDSPPPSPATLRPRRQHWHAYDTKSAWFWNAPKKTVKKGPLIASR
jgi:hypothetical protein